MKVDAITDVIPQVYQLQVLADWQRSRGKRKCVNTGRRRRTEIATLSSSGTSAGRTSLRRGSGIKGGLWN